MATRKRGQRVPFAAIGAAARADVLDAYDSMVAEADEAVRTAEVRVGDEYRDVAVDLSGEVAFKDGAARYTQIPISDRLKVLAKYGWMKKTGQRAVAMRRRAGVTKQGRAARKPKGQRSRGQAQQLPWTTQRSRSMGNAYYADSAYGKISVHKDSSGWTVYRRTTAGEEEVLELTGFGIGWMPSASAWPHTFSTATKAKGMAEKRALERPRKKRAAKTAGQRVRVREGVWHGGVPLGKPARKKTPKRKPYYEWADEAALIEAGRATAGYLRMNGPAEAVEALAWHAGYEQGAGGRTADPSKPAKLPPKWAQRWAKQYMVGWADGKGTRT